MIRNLRVTALALAALLFLSSCGAVMGTPAVGNTPVPTLDPQTQIAEAVAATILAQTQVAQSVEQTLAALVSDTPAPTATASNTPTLTVTPQPSPTITPVVPMVTVSADTNCRSGPGRNYDLLGVLKPGETTEVVGRTTVVNYWLVRNPDDPTQFCWLWGQYATLTGSWESLPQATQPPTPTPSAGLSISYLNTITCAPMYAFRFQFENNGTATWKSYRVVVVDATTSTTKTYTDDFFRDVTGCGAPVNQLQDLEPGEDGVAGNWGSGALPYNPDGHSLTATFTLCTLDGLAGECVDKVITFIP